MPLGKPLFEMCCLHMGIARESEKRAHIEAAHFKKGLPSALQPWLVVGTREGSSDSSWADSLWLASSVPPTSHCCKKIDEGTSKYRHKIYLPGGYTIPSPRLPQGQQMPAFILRLKMPFAFPLSSWDKWAAADELALALRVCGKFRDY